MPPNDTDVTPGSGTKPKGQDSAAPRARSYSQLSRYTDCAKSFELSYERRVPRRPGVYFPAGSAMHKTIERYLREIAVPREQA